MNKHTVLILGYFLLMLNTACIHTSKISKLYNNGAQLKSTDVVLFMGFNGQHSRTSETMMAQTDRILKKFGIKVLYMHNTDFNYEFVKAGFRSTDIDIENPDFIDNMVRVYGLSYVFNVGNVANYQGERMGIDRNTRLFDETGVVFEVYSVTEQEVVASMHLSGSTIHFISFNEPEDRTYGNIHKNYAKGLRKLMKPSKY